MELPVVYLELLDLADKDEDEAAETMEEYHIIDKE